MKLAAFILSLLCCSCVNGRAQEEIIKNETSNKIELPQTGWTEAVPQSYLEPASRQGRVERLDYESRDYVRDSSPVTKTSYVYLPYGYDETDLQTRYNIVYLMHGWGGHAGEYFEYSNIKEILDNMIAKGDIEPTIFVSASFYNKNSSTVFGSSEDEFRAFHLDFENHLMPAVEGKYHTYAENTTDEALKASRDHRAFGGFSLGSVTTWLQFCYDYDFIRYFLPMSGSSWYYGTYGNFQYGRNVDFIENLVQENNLDERGYFIYHAVGTSDTVKSQSLGMSAEMLSRPAFTADHYVFYQKEGGYHDFDAVREFMYNALPLFFNQTDNSAKTDAFTRGTLIQDVVRYPAFGDYGRLIFPVNRSYYSGNTLGNLDLTWYSEIDPDKTVEICNYLKNHADAGDTVFYNIYSEEERAADPSKNDTGIFFFRGNPGAKFAVCNAGGGMVFVGSMHDSFPHALEISKKGYNAFAVIYRPGYDTGPRDCARAVAFIIEHADELGVDPSDYSLWGGSAGARIADWVGTYGTAYYGEKSYPQAAAVIMQYTALSEVTGREPATYNCVGTRDGIAPYSTMERRIDRISANGTETMIEVFDGLSHGFGIGTGTVAEGWVDNAVAFWERQMDK